MAKKRVGRYPKAIKQMAVERLKRCENIVPFLICPYRRFPVCCAVIYHAGLFEGHGIVWNLSVNW
jgi:hypothetical protein